MFYIKLQPHGFSNPESLEWTPPQSQYQKQKKWPMLWYDCGLLENLIGHIM